MRTEQEPILDGGLRQSLFKASVFLTVAALLVLFGLRVEQVNASALHYPEKRYAMNERIELGGSYFDTLEGEDQQGYSLTIVGAYRMTPNEYLLAYSDQGPSSRGGADEKSIVCLAYEISNHDNEEGVVMLMRHQLVSVSKNISYTYDDELWQAAYPSLYDGGVAQGGAFSLKKDSSYIAYVPFSAQKETAYFDTYDKWSRMPISDGSFDLLIANAPVRQFVTIEVSE